MKEVIIVSIGFSPNLGGIETHFDDLVSALAKRDWKVDVLTYKPITTKAKVPFLERRRKNIFIFRIPWFGNIFYRLVKKPFLEFVYLTPGLFVGLPILLLLRGRKVKTIHSHGLIAGVVSVFWGKVFGKKVIATTHSIYNFPQSGFYRNLAKWIFNVSDLVLALSKQSKREIEGLGISKEKVKVFTYWIDLKKFDVRGRKLEAKKKVGWGGKFVVLFVGRLIPEKGVKELIAATKIWNKKIKLAVAGSGPLESFIKHQTSHFKHIVFLGRLTQDELPLYYNAADLLVVPSVHEEGFGRVILESLACGTPVIGSNRGAIPEAINESVGKLIDVTPKNIKEAVEFFYKNRDELIRLSENARRYAERKYSEQNARGIINSYSP